MFLNTEVTPVGMVSPLVASAMIKAEDLLTLVDEYNRSQANKDADIITFSDVMAFLGWKIAENVKVCYDKVLA